MDAREAVDCAEDELLQALDRSDDWEGVEIARGVLMWALLARLAEDLRSGDYGFDRMTAEDRTAALADLRTIAEQIASTAPAE
jgi:hypothetical protein